MTKRKLKRIEAVKSTAIIYPDGRLDCEAAEGEADESQEESLDPGFRRVAVRIIREKDWRKREKLLKGALQIIEDIDADIHTPELILKADRLLEEAYESEA